jgi:hypothetical protein
MDSASLSHDQLLQSITFIGQQVAPLVNAVTL